MRRSTRKASVRGVTITLLFAAVTLSAISCREDQVVGPVRESRLEPASPSSRQATTQFQSFGPSSLPITDLGTLGGNTSSAYDINAVGQIVGTSATSAGEDPALLWQNGTM